jgi:hypothetical protein
VAILQSKEKTFQNLQRSLYVYRYDYAFIQIWYCKINNFPARIMQLTFTEIEFKQACHEGNITLDLNEEAFERCGGKVKKKNTNTHSVGA